MLEVLDGRDQSTPVHIPRPRPVARTGTSRADVTAIVEDVRMGGDEAILRHEMAARPDPRSVRAVRVPDEALDRARSLVRPEFLDALEVMVERLRRTCERQLERGWLDEGSGELVGELVRPLRRVGILASAAPTPSPSSVVMCAVPAQVAGVGGIAVASSPADGGEVAEPVLAACASMGVTEVYRMGGAQAVAGLAYGTESVRPVEKIVGRGGPEASSAKRAVTGWVGAEPDEGGAELAIVADASAEPRVVAADLIVQAEHGPAGAHVLVTWEPSVAERVVSALDIQVATHERGEDVENALIEGGAAVLVRDREHAFDTINAFAPQQLELHVEDPASALERIRNAGSVSVGTFSGVSTSDFVAGTNNILPSGGSARWASGVSVRDFVKTIYVSGVERATLERLAPHVDALAEVEGLYGHARAIDLRLAPPRGGTA